ncbi:MAG: hypothetical protein QOC99_1401 [Acidobacteriota bacterium]|nr:hypothetical protein [Acidobacteriota bacterium]
MSNKSLRTLAVLLFAVFATAALVFADLGVLAQNANSSTTGDTMQTSNRTMAPSHGRRGRGHRARRHRAAAATDAAMGATENSTGNMGGEQTDLSGTYTGHVSMSGGHDMDGDGTLTITGNQFTLESGAMNHSGRVHAVTTRGYTGASFWFPDLTDSTTNTPVVATVRARKSGDRLTLSPVPGTRTRLTFASGAGGGRSHGRRGRRGRRGAAPATDITPPPADTTTSGSAAPTAGEAMGTGEGTGTGTSTPRRGRGRRGRRGRTTTTNTNANTGDNSNTTPPM